MGLASSGNPNLPPTVNGRNGRFEHPRHFRGAAQKVDCVSVSDHVAMICDNRNEFASPNCDLRFCDIRTLTDNGRMDIESLKARLHRSGKTQADMAEAINLEPDKVSKSLKGIRRFTIEEASRISTWLEEMDGLAADLPDFSSDRNYLPVEILPSFAGMGGGGSGEGDPERGMVPRHLVEDELNASPSDLLLVDCRGDSMMPDFMHGDQILIDKRDCDPVQPGSFCLWDGDGYVIKLVERVPRKRGTYRIFSANDRYQEWEATEDDIKIMGRPVWFARRL